MKRTLMIVGHPHWRDSFANRHIVDEFARLNPEAVISNVTELYPDGNIDDEAEQKKLLEADIIVMQFPIQWYGCPSTMHKWQEDVLTYGFAYGFGGDKLEGKMLVASFTGATPAEGYSRWGL